MSPPVTHDDQLRGTAEKLTGGRLTPRLFLADEKIAAVAESAATTRCRVEPKNANAAIGRRTV